MEQKDRRLLSEPGWQKHSLVILAHLTFWVSVETDPKTLALSHLPTLSLQ